MVREVEDVGAGWVVGAEVGGEEEEAGYVGEV